MNWSKQLHWLIVPLFVLACARTTAPTGGPKDTIPPTLVQSNPSRGQINYSKQTVDLTFDEPVILTNPKEQIIITPDLGKDYELGVKKNTVSIRFEQKLNETTTYSINFREAVQDITEKNPAKNLKLAFSTGDYIDSLAISGEVYDLQKSTPIKDATVALYQKDTFNIFKHRPTYITKTNEKGQFIIENLKPDTYKIYAIDDKNKNLLIDSKSEAFGFLTKGIDLDSNTTQVTIPVIRLDTRPLTLTSARPSGTMFVVKTSKPINSFLIKSDRSIPSALSPDKNSINIYNTQTAEDSVKINIHITDSINNSIDTLLYVKFSKRETKPEKFEAQTEGFKVIGPKGLLIGQISFNKPLRSINMDSIFYRIDSTTIIQITPPDITFDTNQHVLRIEKKFDKNLLAKKPPTQSKDSARTTSKPTAKNQAPKKPTHPQQIDYQYYIAAKTFISVESDSSRSIQIPTKPTTLESTGVIMVQIDIPDEYFIVQLLSKTSRVLTSVVNTKKVTFEDLDPADYQVRLIIDTNKNGKWDPGNFLNNEEPEQIIYYKNEKGLTNVTLKANWELGPLLITHP